MLASLCVRDAVGAVRRQNVVIPEQLRYISVPWGRDTPTPDPPRRLRPAGFFISAAQARYSPADHSSRMQLSGLLPVPPFLR